MDHKYDAATYKCIYCGAGIYTTGGDCPGKTPEQEKEDLIKARIWKAIKDCAT